MLDHTGTLSKSNLLSHDDLQPTANTFLRAAAYADFQSPVNAVTQLVDASLHTNLLPKVQFMDAPHKLQSEQQGYWAQNLGTAVGSLVPFMLTAAAVKSGSRFSVADSLAAKEAVMGMSSREAFLTGALHDSLLRPTDPSDNKPLLVSRGLAGLAGGTTMVAITKLSSMANDGARAVLAPGVFKYAQIPVAMIATAPAGAFGAQVNALLTENRSATAAEMQEAALTTSLLTGAFGAAAKYGSSNEASLRSFRVDGGTRAIDAGMHEIAKTGETSFNAREDLGRQGLSGLFGMKSYGEPRMLLVRDSKIAAPLSPTQLANLDMLATCYPEPSLRPHTMFPATEAEANPLWMKANGKQLDFTAKEPNTNSEWKHLGPNATAEGLLEKIRTGDLNAARQVVDLLERVKLKQDISSREMPLAEGLLKVGQKTFQQGISPDGDRLLSSLSNKEHDIVSRMVDALRTHGKLISGENVSAEAVSKESQAWTRLNSALDFRVSTIGERRPLSSSELDLVNNINQQARDRIFALEQDRKSGKQLSEGQEGLLGELKDGQDMLFDTIANRQLLDIADIEQSGQPLSFSQAARRRIALRMADEGINYYNRLSGLRDGNALSDIEAKTLSELVEGRNEARSREQTAVESIRANNGRQATDILGARERLKGFQQISWRRQDPASFDQDLAAVNQKQAQLADLSKRNVSVDKMRAATQESFNAQQDMAQHHLPADAYRSALKDLRTIQYRVSDLSRIAQPNASQLAELTELRGVSGQTVEAIFRDYVPWAPEGIENSQSQMVPAGMRKLGLKDGNNDELALAHAFGQTLENQALNLRGNLGYHTPDYLNPKNWNGIHVPDGAAADHAKADLILFNKKTGHYFLFDITSSVDGESANILAKEMVARGDEIGLANKKAMVAPEREPFILATSPMADWSSPTSAAKGHSALARIVSDVVSLDKPFHISDSVPPSTNPAIPSGMMISQLESFQQSLNRMGHSDWARELHAAKAYLRGR